MYIGKKIWIMVCVLMFWVNIGYCEKPEVYIPFDGNLTVYGVDDKVLLEGTADKTEFVEGKKGDGLVVSDKSEIPTFKDLPQMVVAQGTFMLWFKPDWDETDKAKRYDIIRYGGANEFSFYMVKSSGLSDLDINLRSPGAGNYKQIFPKIPFKKDTWNHIAYTWDFEKSEVAMYVNGVALPIYPKGTGTLKVPDMVNNIESCWLKGMLTFGHKDDGFFAGGVIDEFVFYPRVMTIDEIKSLSMESEGLGESKPVHKSVSSAPKPGKQQVITGSKEIEQYREEIEKLKKENEELKELLSEQAIEIQKLKKSKR